MTDDWSPAEIETVRKALATGQDRLRIGPAPWDRLNARRRAATVRRRAWTAGVAVAVAVSVAAVVLTGRGWRTSAPVQPDRPVNGTYGTLAGDTALVRDLRESAPGFGANLRRPGAAAVKVLVATELGGVRLALLRTSGERDSGPWWWAEGLQGASASLLSITHPCHDAKVCWAPYGTQVRPAPGHALGEGVVVAAPPGSQVRVSGATDVLPDGTVHRDVTTVPERWPGVFVAPGPSGSGRLDLEVLFPGSTQPWRDTLDSWDPKQLGLPQPAPALRGNGLTGPGGGSFLLHEALNASAARPQPAPLSLLLSHQGDVQRAVFALPGRSGGWMVVATREGRPGAPMPAAVQALLPRPAGDPARFALAWADPWSGPDAVALLGPREAVRAQLATPRGTVTVMLADGVGTATAADPSEVRFLDGSGRQVGRTTVAPTYRGLYDGS